MEKPIIAVVYDFDKTICTKDMQEYSFIPDIGMASNEFWNESNMLAENNQMDKILAYMYLMLKKADAKDKPIQRKNFVELGDELEFFLGVEEWFQRIDDFAGEKNFNIEHYIISSGLKEIIEGSTISDKFKKVFASEFYYNGNGEACWPKLAVNYTTKTQFIFRINKGVLDISNDSDLNQYTPEDKRRIPFRNMIYIGDGLTDVPCMKLVKSHGGCSIAVYKEEERSGVEELLLHERVDFLCSANYSKNSNLDKTVKKIISKMILSDELIRENKNQVESAKEKLNNSTYYV